MATGRRSLTGALGVMLIAGSLFCATELTPLLNVVGILNVVCSFLNDIAAPLSGFFAAPTPRALAFGLIAALAAITILRDRPRAVAIHSRCPGSAG